MFQTLPELGVGIVYSPRLEPLLEAGVSEIDVIEIEPQSFWFKTDSARVYTANGAAMQRFHAFPQAKLIHGVGFPVGGTCVPDDCYVEPFIETINAVGAAWASEHLSFNRVKTESGEFNTGFFLPPVQTVASANLAAENIARLSARLPVPFAFETGVNYLRRQPGEMADGAFFAAVAEQADCGILLDLHNLWCNQLNGRQSVLDAVSQLPLERVLEIHLAGGKSLQGYWLDAHSDLTPVPLMKLAREIIPLLPNLKAMLFEIMPDYLDVNHLETKDLLRQIQEMRELWALRPSPKTAPLPQPQITGANPNATSSPAPAEWEQALGSLVVGRSSDYVLAKHLADDPGVEVLRRLVTSVRAGMLVDLLRLTYRYLVLRLGSDVVRELMEDFWQRVTPEPFATAEVMNFACYLKAKALSLPHLDEVMAFELALHQVQIESSAKTVRFSCDPMPLLSSLGAGRLPDALIGGNFELTIDPEERHSHVRYE
jgi:uncharacterized protein (UPF0276 family)